MQQAIILDGVRKTFGPKVAVEHLDLSIEQGGLYGFIGPNGAGKTTTIRMIMSIIFPDSGRLSVLGKASAVLSKDRIGYLPEERGVYRKMRVASFLAYMGRLKGLDPGPDLRSRIADWLERVGLEHAASNRCEELSKGMQQKVQFIACVLHEPDLLILDEPFSGLDPVNMRLMRDLFFEQHRQGCTIIFSTHVMHQAEQLCDHIVMINHGKKVLDDAIGSIRDRFDPRALVIEPIDPGVGPETIERITGVELVRSEHAALEASLSEHADPDEVLRTIVQRIQVRRIELKRPSLEDVFVRMVAADTLGELDEDQLRRSLRADATEAVGDTEAFAPPTDAPQARSHQ